MISTLTLFLAGYLVRSLLSWDDARIRRRNLTAYCDEMIRERLEAEVSRRVECALMVEHLIAEKKI